MILIARFYPKFLNPDYAEKKDEEVEEIEEKVEEEGTENE